MVDLIRRSRWYIFTAGDRLSWEHISVTPPQYAGKYIMYTCNLAICHLWIHYASCQAVYWSEYSFLLFCAPCVQFHNKNKNNNNNNNDNNSYTYFSTCGTPFQRCASVSACRRGLVPPAVGRIRTEPLENMPECMKTKSVVWLPWYRQECPCTSW